VSDSTEAAEDTADKLGRTTLAGTAPVDVIADGPGTTTDGNAVSATLDSALEIVLGTDGTGIGNGRTFVLDWLTEEPPTEAIVSELG